MSEDASSPHEAAQDLQPPLLQPHPDRGVLLDELHARPRPVLPAPCLVTRLDIQITPDEAAEHLARLSAHAKLAENARHASFKVGDIDVVFERRTEFVSYTIIDLKPEKDALASNAPDPTVDRLLQGAPGRLVSAIRLHLVKAKNGNPDRSWCSDLFGGEAFAASLIRDGAAGLASDFKPDRTGFIRFLVFDSNTNDVVRGRMVQRILEMEAYRAAAMLALPLARRAGAALDRLDASLDEVNARIAAGPHAGKDRDILHRLTRLAGEAERLRAEGDYRFAAARAYGDLVSDRNDRLREQRVEGHERVGVFIARRLTPALQTCQAVSERQHAMAQRVDRAVRMLTTRVQVDLEDQNSALLDAMNRRAEAQLRLQEAVEMLSTVAITYYGVGLIHYLAKGAAELGWPVNPSLYAGVATPIVFFGTVFGVRVLRRWLSKHPPA